MLLTLPTVLWIACTTALFIGHSQGQAVSAGSMIAPRPPSIAPDAWFGSALSLSPTGRTLAVGAYADHSSATITFSGSAFVYQAEPEWLFNAKLTSPQPTSNEHFGAALGCMDDLIVVAAPLGDNQNGVLYTFVVFEGKWLLHTVLKGSAFNNFGRSVMTDGKLLLVGEWGYSNSTAGAVSVYEWTGGKEWIRRNLLSVSPSYHLGTSLAMSSSLVVSGSDGENDFQGAAYVFERVQNSVNSAPAARLTVSARPNSQFGFAVAILSDKLVAVGCLLHCNAIYMFTSFASGWIQQTIIGSSATSSFGNALSFSAPYLLVGDFGAKKSFLMTLSKDKLSSPQQIASASMVKPYGSYGFAVAISKNNAFVGDFFGGAGLYPSGAVFPFVIEGFPATPSASPSLTPTANDSPSGPKTSLPNSGVVVSSVLGIGFVAGAAVFLFYYKKGSCRSRTQSSHHEMI